MPIQADIGCELRRKHVAAVTRSYQGCGICTERVNWGASFPLKSIVTGHRHRGQKSLCFLLLHCEVAKLTVGLGPLGPFGLVEAQTHFGNLGARAG